MKHVIALMSMLAVATPVWVTPALANPEATAMMNQMRKAENRRALVYSDTLEAIARGHVNDMVRKGFFSHTGSNGSNIKKRIRRGGYRACFVAENIAKGQKSLKAVMATWAGSPPHFKNITARKAREFGLAKGKGNLWVLVMAEPC